MAGQILTLGQSDGVSVAAPSAFSGTKSVSSADFVMTDVDGIKAVFMGCGSSDRLFNLASAANNPGRKITVLKTDSGVGKVTFSSNINGFSDISLAYENDGFVLLSTGSEWLIDGPFFSSLRVSTTFTFNGSGGTVTDAFALSRNGNTVSVSIDTGFRATTGTGSTTFTSTAGALPLWARPSASTVKFGVNIRNNAAGSTDNGYIQFSSAGTIIIQRDVSATAWTNTANGGIQTTYSTAFNLRPA